MATLTTGLPAYGFLDDLPDVVFSGIMASKVYVTVQLDGRALVVAAEMTPDENGRVTVYAKQMIRNSVTMTKPNTCSQALPRLAVRLLAPGEVAPSTSGYVIPGNTNDLGIINIVWFAKNFLTWQPQIIETTRTQPQWLAFVPVPPFDRYEIQSTLYTRDGRTFTQSFFKFPSGPNFQQFRADFTYLWKSHCIAHDLDPYCYDVFGCGYKYLTSNPEVTPDTVPAETTESEIPNRPYAQRYVLRPERYNDVCFGFENTLGAFDTLMLEGKQTYQPEGDILTFKTLSTEKELINDYTSIWEASTGRLETERSANQFQDFMKSTNRYVLMQGIWRRIIVSDYKVKHSRGESNSYTFKYHLADKNEGRYFNREKLPEPELPTNFFPEYDYKKM